MANNHKNFYGISYSIQIGPSTYHVLGHRMRNSKYMNRYFLAEDVTMRSRSAKPSACIQRSKSHRQSLSPKRQSKTNHQQHKVIIETDCSTKQVQSKPNHHYRCSTMSKSKISKKINDKIISNGEKVLINSSEDETTKETSVSIKLIENERKDFVKSILNNQDNEIIQLFDEQKRSLIQLLEQHTCTMISPSIDIIKQIVIETLQSQSYTSTKELEHTLIQTLQQELQKILLKNNDKSQSNHSIDTQTINQLQDILTQTLDKYITSNNKDNHNILNNLFTEQKQALVETLTQQQSISSIDLIRQALSSALSEYNSTIVTTTTTTTTDNITNSYELNNEIEIHADIKQTCIDAAFHQQRNSIVANRYLRDSVRQWSNICSIRSLIEKIQECGTNDFEYAWLIYFWIGLNIDYDINCENNSIEYVFKNRLSSIDGFVNLYFECCSLLNIQCLKIQGFIKQNKDFKQISHIWNGIIIDQYTYLIDITSNIIDNKNQFEDFYFLISPEEFIYTHYSEDYQLLKPKITYEQFLNLPLIKSNYYRLNLNLLKPKQYFNQINKNLFEISLKTPAYVDLIASLQIKNIEYPSHLHTLCQRDLNQIENINCFFAPPSNGHYQIIIYAKTIDETKYQETIYMNLNIINISQTITFPIRSQLFIDYKCILIQPFRRLIKENETLFIHMKIPDAYIIKIKNGNEIIQTNKDEYKDNLLKKEVIVQGDIYIYARWNEKTEKLSTICIFNMI